MERKLILIARYSSIIAFILFIIVSLFKPFHTEINADVIIGSLVFCMCSLIFALSMNLFIYLSKYYLKK